MKKINIDIETYSPADITKTGVYKYVEPDEFEVLMVAYSIDESEETELFESFNKFPQWFLDALVDPEIEKWAFNANFEHTALSKATGLHLPIEQWNCTMVQAARAGYPMSLGAAAKAMGLEQQKDTKGSALIRYFSIPCKPTKANGMRTRNLPEHDPVKWQQFKDYCIQDVVTEMAILDKVKNFPVSDFEKNLWYLDQKINGHGVQLDQVMVNNAIEIYENYLEKLKHESMALTGLTNSNSPAQLMSWLAENGTEVSNLTKENVKALVADLENGDVKRVLELRQEMAKTSVKKYYAMRASVCEDSRCRGLLQFGGATRTFRWGGRLIQVQNLPQNHIYVNEEEDIDNLTLARNLVVQKDSEFFEMLFGNVPDTLSQMIRTAFVAGEGKEFVVGDFAAIEARVIAWVSGEQWRLDVFNTHGKIYEASASKMFKVPLESISYKDEFGKTQKGENYGLRAKGKIAELALGYQGGKGALEVMGALKMGLTEEELPELIKVWRSENEAICQFWYDCNYAAIEAIVNPGKTYSVGVVKFVHKKGNLYIKLPSGRYLSYIEANYVKITYTYNTKQKAYVDVISGKKLNLTSEQVKEKLDSGKLTISKSHITYKGIDQHTKQWSNQTTYGGKLVENCLTCDTLVLTENKGWIPITEVDLQDKVFDGEKWVSHKGLVSKGFSDTIRVDGVGITSDHLILTKYGWKEASQVEGLDRHESKYVDGHKLREFRREKISLDNTVRLRHRKADGRFGVPERKNKILRLQKIRGHRERNEKTRKVPTSYILGLEINESPMSESFKSCVPQLRRQGNFSLPRMGRLSSVLVRYVSQLYKRSLVRESRRKQRILQRQLHLGYSEKAGSEQKMQLENKYEVGIHNNCGSSRVVRDKRDYSTLQVSSQSSRAPFTIAPGRYEQVYDLVNCGDLHRFTVKSKEGMPFIAHNCVQAIARDCLAESLMRLDKEGYVITMHVHDEIIVEVPAKDKKEHKILIDKIMSAPIPWAEGLPLTADSFTTYYYKKD